MTQTQVNGGLNAYWEMPYRSGARLTVANLGPEPALLFYQIDYELTDVPTICGTGTEDYFGGAWNFDVPGQGYTAYTTPYLGLPQIIRPKPAHGPAPDFDPDRLEVV
ncbi:DUF2961 domain-containing protein [Plantactinospora siamensis]|uniref:DUF2961 domain-containing protein n=1 Tax=Plantactinospora siamensis TaxID=555372 RepID=A0ABV6P390_9ACTN